MADNPIPLKPETPEDRRHTAAAIHNIADRYEEGGKIGALLVVAMLPTGFMAVVGVTPEVEDKDLLVFMGIVNESASRLVAPAEGSGPQAAHPAALDGLFASLTVVSGGDA